MALTVISQPSIAPNTFAEVWHAGGNNLEAIFQRKDYPIINFIDSGGGVLRIEGTTNFTTLPSNKGGPIIAGSILWLESDTAGYYGFYTVVSVSTVFITFGAGTYISTLTTGFINMKQRTNYKMLHYPQGIAVGVYLTYYDTYNGRITLNMASSNELKNVDFPEYFSLESYLELKNNSVYSVTTGAARELEVFTNSAESEQILLNDVRLMRVAVLFGENPVAMIDYTDPALRKFLLRRTSIKIYKERCNLISLLAASTPLITVLNTSRYDLNNVFISRVSVAMNYDDAGTKGNVHDCFVVMKDSVSLYSFYGLAGSGTAWPSNHYNLTQIVLAPSAVSKYLFYPFLVALGKTYNFSFILNSTGSTVTWTIRVRSTTGIYGAPTAITNQIVATGNTNQVNTLVSFSVVIPGGGGVPTNLALEITNGASPGNATFTISSFSYLCPVDTLAKQTVSIGNNPNTNEGIIADISAHINCELIDACEGIQLFWRNNLMGAESYIFSGKSTMSYVLTDGDKKKLAKLRGDNLSYSELTAMSSMLTTGEVISVVIDDILLNNKTHRKTEQQIYAIEDGVISGVICTDLFITYNKEQTYGSIELTIQFPTLL